MTQIDKYLSQYLDGSISEQELLDFRDLLESEPQLQTELRQVLDMRSLIHDDLLELTPPESLSNHVLEQVGAQFALLVEEDEEEKRRGLFFLSGRSAGSLVTAMVALVMLALAPGLLNSPSEGTSEDALAGVLVPSTEQVRELPAVRAAEAPVPARSVEPVATRRSAPRVASTTEFVSSEVDANAEGAFASADTDVLIRSGNQGAVQSDIDVASGQIASDPADESFALRPAEEVEYLPVSPEATRMNVLVGSGTNSLADVQSMSTLFDKSGERVREDEQNRQMIAETLEKHRTNGLHVAEESSSPRLSFGFTVGAGGLTRSPSAVAVTQRAGYATYNLNEDNRIGLEAGGSTFRYTHTSFTQTEVPAGAFAKANAVSIYESIYSTRGGNGGSFAIGGFGGAVNNGGGTNGGGAKGGSGGGSTSGSVIDLNKQDDGRLLSGVESGSGKQPPQNVRGIIKAHSYESDTSMGYGMLFYDRKVAALSDFMKIHGRVGVGGTDGGLIFDVRAYAAFATHENVAITIGVGGSALRELKSETPLSANYGVQVGAELGF